jgi:hypothetical protein
MQANLLSLQVRSGKVKIGQFLTIIPTHELRIACPLASHSQVVAVESGMSLGLLPPNAMTPMDAPSHPHGNGNHSDSLNIPWMPYGEGIVSRPNSSTSNHSQLSRTFEPSYAQLPVVVDILETTGACSTVTLLHGLGQS